MCQIRQWAVFGGFPPETTRFLRELRANNRKDWFDAHRGDYEACWVRPAKAFVVVAGQQLERSQDTPPGLQGGDTGGQTLAWLLGRQ
jgi:Conserved hypothetical protein (DUF2461)